MHLHRPKDRPKVMGMRFSISREKNSAGTLNFRISFFVKRAHDRKAKRVREWHASKKLASERVRVQFVVV